MENMESWTKGGDECEMLYYDTGARKQKGRKWLKS